MKFFFLLGASTIYLWEMRRMDNWNPYGAGPRQFGSVVPGVFTPVLANTRRRSRWSIASRLVLTECSETLKLMRKQVDACQSSELTDVTAKVVIYEAFIEGRL